MSRVASKKRVHQRLVHYPAGVRICVALPMRAMGIVFRVGRVRVATASVRELRFQMERIAECRIAA